MDDPREKLIRELRSENCPRSVLDQVNRNIARDGGRSRPFPRVIAFRLVGAVVAIVLGAWLIGQVIPRSKPVPSLASPETTDRTRALEQTQGAIVMIGEVLLRAGTQVESSLLDEAVPPVLKSFHTAKDKLKHSL